MYKVARLVGHSPVTVNIEVKALKAAMHTAVRWKLLTENPFADVRPLRAPDTLPLFFTREELDKLLAVAPYVWFKQLIFFAVSTGMRQGEILNLTWNDVDFSRKLIQIQSGPTFTTKAGKRRSIPMNDSVTLLLQSRALRRRGDLVFTYHGRLISKDYIGHLFRRSVRAAGLDRRLHWHSLRHTHATYLVQAGVPILAVSKLLGHSSVRVTEQHYAALSPENLHDEVNRLALNVSLPIAAPPPSTN
jgi:integrase